MRNRNRLALGCGFLALALLLWGQTRKAGLWELTTVQTWLQAPAAMRDSTAASGGKRTTDVCLTQEMIDKYGAIVPQIRGCQITNIVKTGNKMNADMVCTGAMTGKGTLESAAIDSEHAKGKVHFTGSIQAGSNSVPVEWTTYSSGTFKSADCGDVKTHPVEGK